MSRDENGHPLGAARSSSELVVLCLILYSSPPALVKSKLLNLQTDRRNSPSFYRSVGSSRRLCVGSEAARRKFWRHGSEGSGEATFHYFLYCRIAAPRRREG